MVRRYYYDGGIGEDCETFCDDYGCETYCDEYGPYRYSGYRRRPYGGRFYNRSSSRVVDVDHGDNYERNRRARMETNIEHCCCFK